jgi:acyl-CoA dehydrogenase
MSRRPFQEQVVTINQPLSEADLAIQAAARSLVDELLIPHEVEAEMAGGELPAELLKRQHERVEELGLGAINMPVELGGGGFSTRQQVLVQEQIGRATNALGWVVHTPAGWLPKVATPYQLERWVAPTIRGERRECYAITEEGAGSDVDAIQATVRRDGDNYVLDGVKWHVTSFNRSDYLYFQGKLAQGQNAGAHAMLVLDLETPGIRVVRTPAYMHTIAHHHPTVAFEGVRVPASHLIGDEGDGMRFAHEWFRYERLMIAARALGTADRLIQTAWGRAICQLEVTPPASERRARSSSARERGWRPRKMRSCSTISSSSRARSLLVVETSTVMCALLSARRSEPPCRAWPAGPR